MLSILTVVGHFYASSSGRRNDCPIASSISDAVVDKEEFSTFKFAEVNLELGICAPSFGLVSTGKTSDRFDLEILDTLQMR
mmetsp:Transcript_8282/g.12448  ORF Transcript_8282/g.12448 Transcript_8282/m.12448 type:complete len:81 (-) Transcript_8282:1183-1425(-)